MNDLATITDAHVLTFERRSARSPDLVWRSITDANQVAIWMEAPVTIEPVPGGRWFVAHDDPIDGIIAYVEPPTRFTFAWGNSVVEWTIEPDGDGSRITLVHQGIHPDDLAENGRDVGWHISLDALAVHLGDPLARLTRTEVIDAYRR